MSLPGRAPGSMGRTNWAPVKARRWAPVKPMGTQAKPKGRPQHANDNPVKK